MKLHRLLAAAVIGCTLSVTALYAQQPVHAVDAATAQSLEGVAPGLYCSIDGSLVALKPELGTVLHLNPYDTSDDIGHTTSFEIAQCIFRYRGTSSPNVSDGKFIMICNPKKKAIVSTMRNYFPFIKTMTPELMVLIPLEVRNNRRVYDCTGISVPLNGKVRWPQADFKWEQISEYAYRIDATGIAPGEYGFCFAFTDLCNPDFTSCFTFTVE